MKERKQRQIKREGVRTETVRGGHQNRAAKKQKVSAAGLRGMWEFFLDACYPKRCPFCGDIPPSGDICPVCRTQVTYIEKDFCLKCGKHLTSETDEYCTDCMRHIHAFIQGRSLFCYQEAVKASLYRFKYGNKREYADVYAGEMLRYLGRWIEYIRVQVLIPVPIHSKRRHVRGYNQAEVLALALGRRLGIPVDRKSLLRIRNTVPQKNLDAKARKENLRRAFVCKAEAVRGKRILLVDDIYTTGATVDAAAAALKQAGAENVYVITVASGG